jgi:hypothetical protein
MVRRSASAVLDKGALTHSFSHCLLIFIAWIPNNAERRS